MDFAEAIQKSRRLIQGENLFVLSELTRYLKIGHQVKYFKNLTTCQSDSCTLVPSQYEIGKYENKFIPSTDKSKDWPEDAQLEHQYISSSLGGHTSYVRYNQKDMEEIRKSFSELVSYILNQKLVPECIFNIRNLQELLSEEQLLECMRYANRRQFAQEIFLLLDSSQDFGKYNDSLYEKFCQIEEPSPRLKKIFSSSEVVSI